MNIFMYFYLSCTLYSTVLSRTMSTLCTVGYSIFYIPMLYNIIMHTFAFFEYRPISVFLFIVLYNIVK